MWFASVYGARGPDDARRVRRRRQDRRVPGRQRARAGVDLGATLGTARRAARSGAQWTQVHARVETGDPVLPSVRELTAGVRAGARPRPARSRVVPAARATRSAAPTTARRRRWGRRVNYQRTARGSATYAHSWGAHTVQLSASGGTDFGSDMPAYETFALGGPLRLSGFRINQFAGREFAFGARDVLPPHLRAARPAGHRRLRRRVRRGRPDPGPGRRTCPRPARSTPARCSWGRTRCSGRCSSGSASAAAGTRPCTCSSGPPEAEGHGAAGARLQVPAGCLFRQPPPWRATVSTRPTGLVQCTNSR